MIHDWLGAGPWEAALAVGAFLFAGLVKGALGFGLPLVSMSLMAFALPLDMALAVTALVQFVTNLGQMRSAGRTGETFARFWPVLATLGLGVAVGAAFLTRMNNSALTLTLGLIVTGYAALSLAGAHFRTPPRRERATSFAVGFAAGILGALTAANGPFFVMYLVGLGLERQLFRAALALLFLVSSLLISVTFWSVGFLDAARAGLALLCVPPALAGMYLGDRWARGLEVEGFRRLVLAALLVIGANFLLRGLGAFG